MHLTLTAALVSSATGFADKPVDVDPLVEPILIADFDTPEPEPDRIDPLSGSWAVVNDNIMGGRSIGGGRIEGGSLIFEGSTNTNGGGFASLRARDQRWDLSRAEGIAARIRADGRTYVFHIETSRRHKGSVVKYRGEFTTIGSLTAGGDVGDVTADQDSAWHHVFVPFTRFDPHIRGRNLRGTVAPLDPADVTGVGLMIDDGLDGPFRLQMDWIKATVAPVDQGEGGGDAAPAGGD